MEATSSISIGTVAWAIFLVTWPPPIWTIVMSMRRGSLLATHWQGVVTWEWLSVVDHLWPGPFKIRRAKGPLLTVLPLRKYGSASKALQRITPSARRPIWCSCNWRKLWPLHSKMPGWIINLVGSNSTGAGGSKVFRDFLPVLTGPGRFCPAEAAIFCSNSEGRINWNFTWFPNTLSWRQGFLADIAFKTAGAPMARMADRERTSSWSLGTPWDSSIGLSSCTAWSTCPMPQSHGLETEGAESTIWRNFNLRMSLMASTWDVSDGRTSFRITCRM